MFGSAKVTAHFHIVFCLCLDKKHKRNSRVVIAILIANADRHGDHGDEVI